MVYFGKKSIGNIEALRQEIERLEQALNNCAKKNTVNAFTQQQDFQSIKIGSNYYFNPEENGIRFRPNAENKWVYFGSPDSNYFAGIDLNGRVKLQGVITPTENTHAANKQYVDTQTANVARTNQANTFAQNQIFRGEVEFGSRIKAGYGGALIRFTPEDSTLKTLQFYENNPTDSKRLMLKVATPTDNNHVTNKEYVDGKIKFIEKTGISFTRQELEAGKVTKYWAQINYSDLPIPNGKKIVSCNAKKPIDSQHMLVSFFPSNSDNQALIEVYQYNSTTDITNNLRQIIFCLTYIN